MEKMAEEGKLAREAVQMKAGAEAVVVMVVQMSEAEEAEEVRMAAEAAPKVVEAEVEVLRMAVEAVEVL